MTLELSTITFTDQDDIVPALGMEETRISHTGGIEIDTGDGNDLIIGISEEIGDAIFISGYPSIALSSLNTGDGNDTIIGISIHTGVNVNSLASLDTGKGEDIIIGTGSYGISNYHLFNTGEGNDIIIGTGGRNGYGIVNGGFMDTGDGNDTITGTTTTGYGINNTPRKTLNTGDGDDIITGMGDIGIFNQESTINTGNGNDSIIAYGGSTGAINNNEGIINTGNGNDSIIANGGFSSNPSSGGSVFLENGLDYLEGFGSGRFYGGDGNDTLKLTSGSYTVGIRDTTAIFTQGDRRMITSEFEKLIAGSTIYDFTSLTEGQIIVVA
jgi:Ca2+-binding RTX toxin-like protein